MPWYGNRLLGAVLPLDGINHTLCGKHQDGWIHRDPKALIPEGVPSQAIRSAPSKRPNDWYDSSSTGAELSQWNNSGAFTWVQVLKTRSDTSRHCTAPHVGHSKGRNLEVSRTFQDGWCPADRTRGVNSFLIRSVLMEVQQGLHQIDPLKRRPRPIGSGTRKPVP